MKNGILVATATVLLSACSGTPDQPPASAPPIVSGSNSAQVGEHKPELRLAELESVRLFVADTVTRLEKIEGIASKSPRMRSAKALLVDLDAEIAKLSPPLVSMPQAAPIVDLDTFAREAGDTGDSIRTLSGRRHVGGEVAPTTALPSAGTHGAARVSSGRLRDGTPKADLVKVLEIHAKHGWPEPGLSIGSPPVIRILSGASDRFAHYIELAVRAVNSALPLNRRITIGAPFEVPDRTNWGHRQVDHLPAGTLILHTGLRDLGATIRPRSYFLGLKYGGHREKWPLEVGYLFINEDPNWYIQDDAHGEEDLKQNAVALITHEILHALRLPAHPPDTDSVMTYDRPYMKRLGHYLYRLDRDILLAVSTRFTGFTETDDIVRRLGPWSEYSDHLVGEIDMTGGESVSFGSSLGNGFAAPWAQGPAPSVNLSDNKALSGTASWSGRLLGWTPTAKAVAGAADLSVALRTLTGSMDFTGLESWAANSAPGAIGTGATWGDGDLGYTIAVNGNTFVQTGGDAGTVTGAFFGASHEAMGGTVERTDLSAGFGGKR